MREFYAFDHCPPLVKYLGDLRQAQCLRRLRLSGNITVRALSHVGGFKDLRYLDVNFSFRGDAFLYGAYLELLNQVDQLEQLTTLLVRPPRKNLEPIPSLRLTHLKNLAITGTSEVFTTLCTMTPCIKHILLDFSTIHENQFSTFSRHLARACPALRNLEIYAKFDTGAIPVSVIKDIRPLFPLELESVRLLCDELTELRLSDGDVQVLATAWPRLRHLDLFAVGQYVGKSVPTFQSVIAIARTCRDIHYLRMSVWNQAVTLPTHPDLVFHNLADIYPPFHQIQD